MRERCVCAALLLLTLAASPEVALSNWSPDGIPVCTDPANQYYPVVTNVGAGSALVIWDDNRASSTYNAYGARLTSSGDLGVGWPTNGKQVATGPFGILADLVPDGFGGAYFIYELNGDGLDLYAQHLAASGDPAPGWPSSGLAIEVQPGDQQEAKAAPDDSGGVYILWSDSAPSVIRGIRLHPDGSIAPGWSVNGRVLSTPGSRTASPDVASDGAGGIVATWWEQRLPATDYPAYGFRLTPSGDPYPGWPTGGVLLSQHRPAQLQYQAYITSDGAGGLYSAWADLRNLPPGTPPTSSDFYWDIYGQHVMGDGTIASGWSPDALPICTTPRTQWYPRIIPDGSGGAFAVWNDFRNQTAGYPEDIYAQHLLAHGVDPTWTANGNPVAVGPGYKDLGFHDRTEVVTDKNGGLFVGFSELSAERVYIQHMMGDGTIDPTYGPVGNQLTPEAAGYQGEVAIAPDGQGGVIAAWDDTRGPADPANIWATRIGPDGITAVALTLLSSEAYPDHVSLVWQAPRQMRATVQRSEGSGAWQILADVSTDGEYRLTYDDRSVTPGDTYTYRLSYSDGTAPAYSPESTVLVPRSFVLALAGFRPNPSVNGDAAVSFELPDTKPGRLELLDVTGRRIADRDLSGYVAGRYTERLSQGAGVPAGMYWIKLTHGGKALTTRGVVIR